MKDNEYISFRLLSASPEIASRYREYWKMVNSVRPLKPIRYVENFPLVLANGTDSYCAPDVVTIDRDQGEWPSLIMFPELIYDHQEIYCVLEIHSSAMSAAVTNNQVITITHPSIKCETMYSYETVFIGKTKFVETESSINFRAYTLQGSNNITARNASGIALPLNLVFPMNARVIRSACFSDRNVANAYALALHHGS